MSEEKKTQETPITPENNPTNPTPSGEADKVKKEITAEANPAKTPAELPTIEELKKEAEGLLSTASGIAAAVILGEVEKHHAEQEAKKAAELSANTAFPPSYETGTEERRLEVLLTEADKEEKRREVMALLKRKQQNESAIKRLNDHYKAEIKNDGNKIQELMELVEAGKEQRAVKCLRLSDFSRRRVTIFRLDLDKVVEDRGLKEDEIPRLKQADLPFDRSKPAGTVEEAVERVKEAQANFTDKAKGGEKSPAESHLNPATESPAEGSSSNEIQSALEQIESEIGTLAKQQEAEPTSGGALRLVALDREAVALRVDLREALRAEQEAAAKKKAEKAEKAGKKTGDKAPEAPPVTTSKTANKGGFKAGDAAPVSCRVIDKEICFFVNGAEQGFIEFRKRAATALVSFLVGKAGSAAKLLDLLTPYPTTFSKRTVQRYAAGEVVVSDDFLRGLAECIPAAMLKEFSIAYGDLDQSAKK